MTTQTIAPTAIVEEGANIGDNVTIEHYAVIKANVTLEDNVTIRSHAYIDGNTFIGEGTTIYPGAVIGTKTQDLKYRGEKTYIRIGKNCEIREYVTINSSCGDDSAVTIGDNCLIMAYCHIAHNCEVGNHVIMSNNATLAGHVIIEDHAIIGGFTPLHQFLRVGRHAMVGGMSRIPHDVPPFLIVAGIPAKLGGLNQVGLKRHGFSLETRLALTQAYKILYRSNLRLGDALNKIESEVEQIPEVIHFLNFCRSSERGIIGLHDTAPNPKSEEDKANLITTR